MGLHGAFDVSELCKNFAFEKLRFRSLSTFSVHIVEQLCRNLESAVNAAYFPTDEKMHNISSTESVPIRSIGVNHDRQTYPTNYAIGVSIILRIIFYLNIVMQIIEIFQTNRAIWRIFRAFICFPSLSYLGFS